MIFPLVGVPNWLAIVLPLFFSPEQHHNATVGPFILCLIVGIGAILPAVIDGKKTDNNRINVLTGIGLIGIGMLFLAFGGYVMLLLIILCGLFLFWAIFDRIPRIFGWKV